MWVLRALGALLIVVASSSVGRLYADKFGRRRRELKAFSDALERLETEVFYGSTPLPTALERVAEGAPSSIRPFFQDLLRRLERTEDLPGAWRSSLEGHFSHSCLAREDLLALLPLSDVLGTSDRNDQRRHLKSVGRRLRQHEETARSEEDKNAKLWRSVGLLGGVALAILFL